MTKKNAIKGVGITALAGLLVIGGSLAYFILKESSPFGELIDRKSVV